MGKERVNSLSATDLWLLLEAAYNHDLGMVLTDEEARQIWTSVEFATFTEQTRSSSDIDLKLAAELTQGRINTDSLATWPLDIKRAVALLLAEFTRRKHASRSGTLVRNPGLIGLESPRTGLLPERLFGLLGDICHSHGMSFDDTMVLPKVASGMGADNAHPRFIACMLRVGDLLDLDNGRFCPVMQRISGATPGSSLAHIEKHAAIKHLLVSPELIEVDAECETYPGYEATWQWLDCLRREIQDQMLKWSEISPPNFGALPSLGKIETRQKKYLALQPGRRPRFEVDQEATLKLLQGANLYPRHEDPIRELVQNAVDASLLRLWMDSWSRLSVEQLQAKNPQDIRQALSPYPVDVTFDRLHEGTAWRITIQDHGTGIAFADLRYLLTVGSSKKNPKRRHAIQCMPEWMRPSGIFGIGLQSVFLLTREVVLVTRHHDTGESYEITLRANEVENSSGLLIRRLEEDERAATLIGTRVAFTVQTGRFPASTFHDGELSTANKLLSDFDPILNEEVPYFVARVSDLIHRLAPECLCTLRLNKEQITQELKPSANAFDRISGCELGFFFDFTDDTHSSRRTSLRYRGTPVTDPLHWPLVAVSCNAHIGHADEFLTLNRGQMTPRGAAKLHQRINDAIQRLLPSLLVNLRASNLMQAQVASLLGHLLGLADAGDEWKYIKIESTKQISRILGPSQSTVTTDQPASITLGEIITQPRILYLTSAFLHSSRLWLSNSRDGESSIMGGDDWIHDLLSKHFPGSCYDGIEPGGNEARYEERYIYSKAVESDIITDRGLLIALLRQGLFPRSTIPCQRDFQALRITDKHPGFSPILPELEPRMVSPFIVRKQLPDDGYRVLVPRITSLVKWVHEHSAEPLPSKEAIAQALLHFIRKADRLLASDPTIHREYDLSRLEHELEMSTR